MPTAASRSSAPPRVARCVGGDKRIWKWSAGGVVRRGGTAGVLEVGRNLGSAGGTPVVAGGDLGTGGGRVDGLRRRSR
jgi:hypothetical protein